VVQLLSTEISTNRIETKLDLSDSPVEGTLDEASIRAAILNLVLNAIQAMPNGGRLTISTGVDGENLWLLIRDTGTGMSPDQIQKIFEPFSTTKSRGLGLGMPYAQKIIERHGGQILVHSELKRGTEVRLELPINIELPALTGVQQ
jgi:signal transduction histidine kinase